MPKNLYLIKVLAKNYENSNKIKNLCQKLSILPKIYYIFLNIKLKIYRIKNILMANNKSGKKRILINERNRVENRYYKSSVRTLTKMFLQDVEVYKTSQDSNDKTTAQNRLSSVYSLIDKGTKRNVFPKNTAARKKSKLAAKLKVA